MDHLRHQKYNTKQLKNIMDELEKKELTKKRTFPRNTWYDWYDWLINYIPEPIKKPWAGLKTKL